MKRNALIILGILASLVSTGIVFGKDISIVNKSVVIKQTKITVDEARKIALKKIDGKVEDEYTIEDEDENVTTFVFVIKNNKGKTFEVQVDANNGNVLNVDELSSDSDEEEDADEPPKNDEPVATTINESESEYFESTAFIDENYSNETPTYVSNRDDSDKTPVTGKAEYKITIEEARKAALEKAIGIIQSEELVNADEAYYLFFIKSQKDKMTEVRVYANSGKAKRFENKPAKPE